ncbi:hypothetical protein GGQ66_002106 [Rhizobium borbori]|uniref:Helix-turn-helix domain-containing protein n=1 Tax=Allorhizobium borbori TaxID=485907 RepID=A0A7W6K1M2_9HYPH|nr:hypothetical protein [Allorhizobium borbori]
MGSGPLSLKTVHTPIGDIGMPNNTETPDTQIDLIWGAEEIAKVIGRSARVTFHLLTTGALPARKVGGRWVIERSKLIAFFTGSAS